MSTCLCWRERSYLRLCVVTTCVYIETPANTQLYEAYASAKKEWLASQSEFRTADISAKSATTAAAYSKSMYDKYASAKSAGQEEYDKTITPLNEEKAELTKTIPILKIIQKMVQDIINEQAGASTAAAKSGVQSLSSKNFAANIPAVKLSQLKNLADKALVPSKDASSVTQLAALRSMLQEADHIDKHLLLKIPTEIIHSMQARLGEIEVEHTKMLADLAEDDALYSKWQTQLVELSDAKDESANKAMTADLQRAHLAGVHEVKEAAYVGYHGAFVEEAAQVTNQVAALKMISVKIDAAIEQCAGAEDAAAAAV